MPFVQRVVEPKYLSKTSLWDADGHPLVDDDELEACTNNTLSNALRQLASLLLVANDIFNELNKQLADITGRSEKLKVRIATVDDKVQRYDPKTVTVPESDLSTFALLREHHVSKHDFTTKLFTAGTRPTAVQALYEAAAKTPVHLMRQMDRWRRDGHRSSRFFLCTPVLGAKRRKIRNRIDIDIETMMPAAVEELRRWTSSEALGDITVAPDGSRITCNNTTTNCNGNGTNNLTDGGGDITDGTVISDDEGIDHKLPSPEEQLQVVALKFPAEIVKVDVTGKSFDRMSLQRRSLLHADFNSSTSSRREGGGGRVTTAGAAEEGENATEDATLRRRTKTRRPRNRRRNTLAGTDQKEIIDVITSGEAEVEGAEEGGEEETEVQQQQHESNNSTLTRTREREKEKNGTSAFGRSRSTDILRNSSTTSTSLTTSKSPEASSSANFSIKKQTSSHFNSLKQWGKNRLRNFNLKSTDSTSTSTSNTKALSQSWETKQGDLDDVNIYETVTTVRRRRSFKATHERKPSSSSEKSVNVGGTNNQTNVNVKLRENSLQRRMRRKDEPHSSSGNWSASSESGRASIGSEITTHPKSTTSCGTTTNSMNSLNTNHTNQTPQHSVSTTRRRCFNNCGSSTSEGTLTPDIIHDLRDHEHDQQDQEEETSSEYSCDTEGYYTSFHMDSGLKTLKEEDSSSSSPVAVTPLHVTSVFSSSCNNAENEYELFGKGSTSTTTSSAGTVCTTLQLTNTDLNSTSNSNCNLNLSSLSCNKLVPLVPERKSSLKNSQSNSHSHSQSQSSPGSSLERNFACEKTGTVKRSPATITSTSTTNGSTSPDSGLNTRTSLSPNDEERSRRSSEFEFSESSDMEGPERIERIRVKTTINSSRIPSMCAITPPHSDDEYQNQLENQHQSSTNIKENKTLLETNLDMPDFDFKNDSSFKTKLDILNFSSLTTTSNSTTMLNSGTNKEDVGKVQVQVQLINVNPQTGYATIETVDPFEDNKENVDNVDNSNININNKNINVGNEGIIRSASPSGGTLTIKKPHTLSSSSMPTVDSSTSTVESKQQQGFKSTFFGKIKTNLSNYAHGLKSNSNNNNSSSNKASLFNINSTKQNVDVDVHDLSGDYVTIADVRNNNNNAKELAEAAARKDLTSFSKSASTSTSSVQDVINSNLNAVLSGKDKKETEYVCLNELPSSITIPSSSSLNPHSSSSSSNVGQVHQHQHQEDSLNSNTNNSGSLGRQGARVILDAEGKVVYTSDSLKRRKNAHSTFEPGPFVKSSTTQGSPLPDHRVLKNVRPVIVQEHFKKRNGNDVELLNTNSTTPKLLGKNVNSKIVIRASSGMNNNHNALSNHPKNVEVVRMPPSTIVCASSPHSTTNPSPSLNVDCVKLKSNNNASSTKAMIKSQGGGGLSGAYVHLDQNLQHQHQDVDVNNEYSTTLNTSEEERALSPSSHHHHHPKSSVHQQSYNTKGLVASTGLSIQHQQSTNPVVGQTAVFHHQYAPGIDNKYLHQLHHQDQDEDYGGLIQRNSPRYSTLPSRSKTQVAELYQQHQHQPERSVTPDITRGLINHQSRQYNTISTTKQTTRLPHQQPIQQQHQQNQPLIQQYQQQNQALLQHQQQNHALIQQNQASIQQQHQQNQPLIQQNQQQNQPVIQHQQQNQALFQQNQASIQHHQQNQPLIQHHQQQNQALIQQQQQNQPLIQQNQASIQHHQQNQPLIQQQNQPLIQHQQQNQALFQQNQASIQHHQQNQPLLQHQQENQASIHQQNQALIQKQNQASIHQQNQPLIQHHQQQGLMQPLNLGIPIKMPTLPPNSNRINYQQYQQNQHQQVPSFTTQNSHQYQQNYLTNYNQQQRASNLLPVEQQEKVQIPNKSTNLNQPFTTFNLNVRASTINSKEEEDLLCKISPIDPRNSSSSSSTHRNVLQYSSGSFKTSTPSKPGSSSTSTSSTSTSSVDGLKSAMNLESKLLSPKKSTMSNEELYAIIHKSKKKMNIDDSTTSSTSSLNQQDVNTTPVKSSKQNQQPETGYLGGNNVDVSNKNINKARSRLSWSPSSSTSSSTSMINSAGNSFNSQNVQNSSPPSNVLSNESRSRQSWACSDRKGSPQTSRLDFKRLLLQHGSKNSKKLSAVEQLKLSKQQLNNQSQNQSDFVNILDLSGSPRTFGNNRKFATTNSTFSSSSSTSTSSPKHNSNSSSSTSSTSSAVKLLSPRSQWKFANPRSDVLSSTILEDCGEDESLNSTLTMSTTSTTTLKQNDEQDDVKKETIQNNIDSNSNSNVKRPLFQSTSHSTSSTTSKPSSNNAINESMSKKMSLAQRLQAQRAQFFGSNSTTTTTTSTSTTNSTTTSSSNVNNSNKKQPNQDKDKEEEENRGERKCPSPPTLETAF